VHYATALSIDPSFVTSQIGLGDTSALMGDYPRARREYDKALPIITTPRDRLHAQFQRTLVYFWEGQPRKGGRHWRCSQGKSADRGILTRFMKSAWTRVTGAEPASELQQLRAV